jgi:hypothetical protein
VRRGIRQNRWRSDNRQGNMKVYPGSCPLGGGSLHPANNLVYDHSCVYRSRRRRVWSCVACNVIGLSRGCPWWLYICNHLGFTRSFLVFYFKSACWSCAISGPCGIHVSFEWACFLAESGYAKSEDPMGHVLITHHYFMPALKNKEPMPCFSDI